MNQAAYSQPSLTPNHYQTSFACPACSQLLALKVPAVGSITGPCPFCNTLLNVIIPQASTAPVQEVAQTETAQQEVIDPNRESTIASKEWDEWEEEEEEEEPEFMNSLESRKAGRPRPKTPLNDSNKKSLWVDSIVAHAYRPSSTGSSPRRYVEKSLVPPKWH